MGVGRREPADFGAYLSFVLLQSLIAFPISDRQKTSIESRLLLAKTLQQSGATRIFPFQGKMHADLPL